MISHRGECEMNEPYTQHEYVISGKKYIVKNYFSDNGKQIEKIIEDLILRSPR